MCKLQQISLIEFTTVIKSDKYASHEILESKYKIILSGGKWNAKLFMNYRDNIAKIMFNVAEFQKAREKQKSLYLGEEAEA